MIQPEILSVEAVKKIVVLMEVKDISLSSDDKLAISEIIGSVIRTAQNDACADTINKQINYLTSLKQGV